MGRYKQREMPGVTARALLREAGFADVASRGTPPPIVLYTPIVTPETIANAKFTLTTDSVQSIRDVMQRMLREEIPKQIAESFRAVHAPVVW